MVKLVHVLVKNGHLEAERKLTLIRKHAGHYADIMWAWGQN